MISHDMSVDYYYGQRAVLSFQVKSPLYPVSDNLPHLYNALKITDQFYRYGQLSNGIRVTEMTNMEICVSANLIWK